MNLQHLSSLTTPLGLYEHCLGTNPRVQHGYCTDDVARGLMVIERLPYKSIETSRLASIYLDFLAEAQSLDGAMHNRRSSIGMWVDQASVSDHWGRALWAWGTSLHYGRDSSRAARSFEHFETSARRRSPYLRSMMFAALGASEVLRVLPGNKMAENLLIAALETIPTSTSARWPWPEARLTYANAAIPEVMMLGGEYFNDANLIKQGKKLLHWLVDLQSIAGRFSIIPHFGWSYGQPLPGYDQQPIEVAALVDACCTAYELTSDQMWREMALIGRSWFDGNNDQGISMHDPATGAGFDALTGTGRNENAGAESTIAYLSVVNRTELLLGVAA